MGSLDVAQRGRTEAAKAAGYSAKTAAFQASRLLKNVKVKRLIAQLTAAQNKKLDISVERTLEQIARHAYVDPRALFNDDGTLKKISELDADTAACIAGVQSAGACQAIWHFLGDCSKMRGCVSKGSRLKNAK